MERKSDCGVISFKWDPFSLRLRENHGGEFQNQGRRLNYSVFEDSAMNTEQLCLPIQDQGRQYSRMDGGAAKRSQSYLRLLETDCCWRKKCPFSPEMWSLGSFSGWPHTRAQMSTMSRFQCVRKKKVREGYEVIMLCVQAPAEVRQRTGDMIKTSFIDVLNCQIIYKLNNKRYEHGNLPYMLFSW